MVLRLLKLSTDLDTGVAPLSSFQPKPPDERLCAMRRRMRVRPFPLSARDPLDELGALFGARIRIAPAAGALAGVIDNFV